MPDRYIKASELRSFDFSARAWSFEQRGAPTKLEPERIEGRREHTQHAQAAVQAQATSHIGIVLLRIGLAALALGILLWVMR